VLERVIMPAAFDTDQLPFYFGVFDMCQLTPKKEVRIDKPFVVVDRAGTARSLLR
jgi:hypothetical protein